MVRLMGRFAGLAAALQFLTRVPIRLRRAPALDRMVGWFPVAGALIGAAIGGVAAGLWFVVPPMVAAAVAVAFGLLLTGAFHEDGLGDVADAFGGGWTVERRLEILKDSRHGTYGVCAIVASLLVRVAAIGSLPDPATAFAGVTAAHCLARAGALGLMGWMPVVTASGLGTDYGQSATRARAAAGIAAGAGIAATLVGWWVVPLAVAVVLSVVAVGALARRKIGGISGDVLGAAEQVAECAVLVVVSGLATHGDLWWSHTY
ncbi:MAG: adenosylcobinamide-GDP ribazoletransferase [Nocardioides sp.]